MQWKRLFPTLLLTALFFVIAVAFGLVQIQQTPVSRSQNDEFCFELRSNGQCQTIAAWLGEDECGYVFLPAYIELSDVYIRTETAVQLDGKLLEKGENCGNLTWNHPYSIVIDAQTGGMSTLEFRRSESVAAMYIKTESGSSDYIHGKKGNKESGFLTLVTADGALNCNGALESIRTRGNYTWMLDKKPYGLTLTDAADLLGLGKGREWVLLANATDPSNMRNKLVYGFANDLGMPGTPDCDWVDLYLNGEYRGLYLLAERIAIGENQLDIAEADTTDGSSFIVSLEPISRMRRQKYPYIETNHLKSTGDAFRVHAPSNLSKEQRSSLKQILQEMEDAVFPGEHADPAYRGCELDYIDLESWVHKYLIEETFENQDPISQYFYRNGDDPEGKIYAGPVWDFDISIGRGYAGSRNPYTLYTYRAYELDAYASIYSDLYENSVFFERLTEVYAQEFLPRLEALLENGIDGYAVAIQTAATNNALRWPSDESFEDAVTYLREYLAERMAFLNSAWIDRVDYCQVCMGNGDVFPSTLFACVPRGECFTDPPVLKDTDNEVFIGWQYADTGEMLDPLRPVTNNLALVAVWEKTLRGKAKALLHGAFHTVPGICFVILFVGMVCVEWTRNRKGRKRRL